MTMRSARASAALVLLAATIWGVSGLLVRTLVDFDLSPVQIVYYSNALAFLILLGVLAAFAPRFLRVPWRVLPKLGLVGLLGGGLTFLLYTSALALTTLSLATLLLYTAPAWVTLLAWKFLGEQVGVQRLVAVGAAFLGCALVARLYDPSALQGSLLGVLFGLLSGLTYAVFAVFGKSVLLKNHPLSVTVYGQGTTALLLLPLQSAPLPIALPGAALPWLLLFVLGPSIVAPLAFNLGLRRLEAGTVTLLGMWELPVAVTLGVLVLSEPMELPQAAGALLIAASVFALRPPSSAAEEFPLGRVAEAEITS